MPISMTCAGCQAMFDVPDNLAGKTIRCTSCKAQMTIPAAGEKKPFGWATKTPPPAPIVEEFDDEPAPTKTAPKPAVKVAAVKAAKPVIELDDDDEDDEPKAAPKKAAPKALSGIKGSPPGMKSTTKGAAARRKDDDDDDDDDEPRRGKKKAAGGSNVALLAGGGLALCAVIGVAVWLLTKEKKSDTASATTSTSSSGTSGTSPPDIGSRGPRGMPGGGPGAGGADGLPAPGPITGTWQAVQGDGFTCEMPGAPNVSTQNLSGQNAKVYLVGDMSGEGMMVMLATLPNEASEAVKSVMYDEMIKGMGKGGSGFGGNRAGRESVNAAAVQTVTVSGVSGREVPLMDGAKQIGILRILIAGTKMFIYGGGSDLNASAFTPKVRRFVDSFKLDGAIESGASGQVASGAFVPPAGPRGMQMPSGGGSAGGPVGGAMSPKPGGGPMGFTAGPAGGGAGLQPPIVPLPGAEGPMGTAGAQAGGGGLQPPIVPLPGAEGAVPPGGAGGANAPAPPPPPPGGAGAFAPPAGGGLQPPILGPGGMRGGPGGGPQGPGGLGGFGGGADSGPALIAALTIDSFYAAAFDAEKKEFFTIGARTSASGAQVMGRLRRYSYPDFKQLGMYDIPSLATRAVVDSEKGLLYVASVPGVPKAWGGQAAVERQSGTGDVQVFELDQIRSNKISDRGAFKPLATMSVGGSIRGLELSPDGKSLFCLTCAASGAAKASLYQFETTERKLVGKPTQLPPAYEMRKSADGKHLLVLERWVKGDAGTSIVRIDMMAPDDRKSLPLPGPASDVAAMKKDGQLVTGIMGSGGNKLHVSEATGAPAVELSVPAAKVATGWYLAADPEGKHLFVGSGGAGGFDAYEVTDLGAQGGLKSVASARNASNGRPLMGAFEVAPDGEHLVFHIGTVLKVSDLSRSAVFGAGAGGFGAPGGEGGFAPPGGAFQPPGAPGGFQPPGAPGGFGAPGAPGGFQPPGAPGGFGAPGAPGGLQPPGGRRPGGKN